MIVNRGIIKVDNGIEYITEWVDEKGQYVFDRYLNEGKLIVNKKVTGCGFTTCCLLNNENIILVSPRITLIRNKMEDFERHGIPLYYYDREKKVKKKGKDGKPENLNDVLASEFKQYYESCKQSGRNMKILVTYDSFCNLVTMMEQEYGIDISNDFRIAIDESHTIVKDVKLKEYSNKCVLSNFLRSLFHYDKLLFISATPIVDYVKHVPEFISYNVDYLELDWPNISPVTIRNYGCKNATDAFDQIFANYSKHLDPNSKNYFDVIHYGEGKSDYSYEGVVFLNTFLI